MNTFEAQLKDNAKIIDLALDGYLPKVTDFPKELHEAMRYSTMAGGKRIRPIMVMEAAKLFGLSYDKVLPTACGIEMIHTYSLIHDDLPAMDDDDFRRGKPTCHKVFGEAMAVLAGDALLTQAFLSIVGNISIDGISTTAVIDVIEKVSKACGSQGMVGGQAVDINLSDENIDEDTLLYISRHKTGCLITASLWAGARLAEASSEDLEIITSYGKKIGLLFQIVDDILDFTGDETLLGKPVGSDLKNNKNTFPKVYGYENSLQLMERLSREAKQLICAIDNCDFFIKLTDFILMRQY